VSNNNILEASQILIECAIKTGDKENLLQAIEILGLLSILFKDIFVSYVGTFKKILTKTEDACFDEIDSKYDREHFLKEKIIALKCTIDGILLHGICSDTVEQAFDLITTDYLKSKNIYLRQVTIEGVCKLLITKKIEEDQSRRQKIEAILG
jgi:hypothetical protein